MVLVIGACGLFSLRPWQGHLSRESTPQYVIQNLLLHLIKHVGKSRFDLQSLLDFVRAEVWILAVFQKARALVRRERT